MHPSHDGASLRADQSTLPRLAVLVLAALFAMGALLTLTPTPASAATAQAQRSSATQHSTAAQRFQSKADRVLRVTRAQKGDPYVYGAAGPRSFDCSGLVMYVYRHALGKSLPHNAEAQYRSSHHIRRSHLMPGDLVFQMSGHYAFHVGIYAGHGYMWDAPHSGARVHKHKMYSAHWAYGRLIHWS